MNHVPSRRQFGTAADRRVAIRVVLGLLVGVIPLTQTPARGNPPDPGTASGLIFGTLFTAQHVDSFAAQYPIELIYREADGPKQRLTRTTDEQGRFAFSGLPLDPSVSFVLRVPGESQPYLSAPLTLGAGRDRLQFNFVAPGPLPGRKPTVRPVRSSAPISAPSSAPSSAPAGPPPSPPSEGLNEWLILGLALSGCALIGLLARRRRPRLPSAEGKF